jgi:hypothetical protein
MKKAAYLAVFLFFYALSVHAQDPSVIDTISVKWDTLTQPSKGPMGSRYYQHGESLFYLNYTFSSPRYVVESKNKGKTWHKDTSNLWGFFNESAVFKVKVDSCRYIGDSGQGVAVYGNDYHVSRSLDGGKTYSVVKTGILKFHPGNDCSFPDISIFQGSHDSTLILKVGNNNSNGETQNYITTDLGTTWKTYTGQYYFIFLNNTAFNSTDRTVYYTREKDMTYKGDSIDISKIALYPSHHSDFIVKAPYFSIINYGSVQYTTANRGQSWQVDTLPFTISQLFQKEDTLILATNKGLFTTTDIYLKNLKKLYPRDETTPAYHTGFSMLKSGWYLNNYKGELLRSINNGETWELVNNTEGVLPMPLLNVFGDSIWLIGANGFTFKAKDFNTLQPHDGITIGGYSSSFKRNNALFVSTGSYLYRSKDGGLTWQSLLGGAYQNGQTAKQDSVLIYGLNFNSLYFSKNNGDSITTIRQTDDIFARSHLIDVVFAQNTFYALTQEWTNEGLLKKGYHVFKSTDEGKTWTKTPFYHADGIELYKPSTAKLFYVKNKLRVTTFDNIIYESKNGGDSWSNIVHDFSYDDIIEHNNHLIYIEKSHTHFKITADDGLSFTYVLDIPRLSSYKFSKGYIYAHPSYMESYSDTNFTFRISLDSLTNRIKALKEFAVLRGSIFKDENNNCQKEGTEKGVLAHKMLRIMPRNYATMTDSLGHYNITLPPDTYTISTTNIPYYKISCSDSVLQNIVLKNNETKDTNFVFKKTNEAFDLAIRLSTGSRAGPGFDMDFILKIDNNGTEKIDSALVSMTLPDKVSFINSPQDGVLKTNQVQWKVYNQSVSTSTTLTARLRLSPDAPLSIPLIFKANVEISPKKDTFPLDNLDSLRLMVTGSFDPNDKTVLPEGKIPFFTKELDYLIRFQNTGNDTAFKVVVVDTLPPNLDILSVKNIVASHPFSVSVMKNILTFTFSNILLPDSFVNERASHGFIRFKVMPKKALKVGESIANKAAIYFDFNKPIITNTAQSDIIKPLVTIQQTVQLCENERFKGKSYFANTTLRDSFYGTHYDTLSLTHISIKPQIELQKDTTLKSTEKFLGKDWKDGDIALVKLKTIWGCDSIIKYIIHKSTAIDDDMLVKNIFLKVYPNPVTDYLSISYELKTPTWVEIRLYNIIGQKVKILKEKTLHTEGVYSLQSDLNLLNTGIYQIGFLTPEGIIYRRVVKIE